MATRRRFIFDAAAGVLVPAAGFLLARRARAGFPRGATTTDDDASSPANVQIILQGTAAPNDAAMFSCSSATPECPGYGGAYTLYYGSGQSSNLNQIGWKGVAGATSYAIYRAVNGGAYSLLATISATTAQSNYSSYVSNQGSNPAVTNIDCAYTDGAATNVVSDKEYPPVNLTGSVSGDVFTVTAVNANASSGAPGTAMAGQGIGGPGMLPGTTINAYGSGGTTGMGGVGTYQLSQAASAPSSGNYGTQYFPNTGYTYYVESEVGGMWSAPSSYAYIPYIIDGKYITCGGYFGGPASLAAAPETTTLGYANAIKFPGSSSNSVIAFYAGNSAADQALNIAEYGYLNVALYTAAAGVNLVAQVEVPGDNTILGPGYPLSNLGFGNLTPNAWTVYKIPLSGLYIDEKWSGSGVRQNSFYKISWQYNYGTVGSADLYWEMWFSVN